MKPEFMRLRRALAGALAALLMAVGIVVLSPALSASAHHNTISVSVACVDSQWKITWNITNSEYDKTETITSSSDESLIAKNTVIAEGATHTASEFVDSPVQKTLSLTATWSNGVTQANSKTLYANAFQGDCAQQDEPRISISGESCTNPSTQGGTVSFMLTGATKQYTVTLTGPTTRTTTTYGGPGTFLNVPAGTYTVTAAAASGESATSTSVTLTDCAPASPALSLTVAPCVAGGSLGAVTASLSNLALGSSYQVRLFSAAGAVLDTLPLTATATSATLAFPGHGPGTYYATVTSAGGATLATSANATITECTVDFAVTVQLEPCTVFQTGTAREISVSIAGMAPSTVYTVRLVTADAAATEIDSTTTPGDSATVFAHTFTGVPTPGDYRVLVTGGADSFESEPVAALKCDLDTLAPPSIELFSDQCDGSGSGIDPLSARMIDLDATKTYYVRIVDSSGATVLGGEDRTVSGSTTATVEFPDVTTTGTYTAQLLIDPGKQLAATSPAAVDFSVCLPTLAMTGPGALVPLGSIAALLLTLGGAVVMGRLRRRMAL